MGINYQQQCLFYAQDISLQIVKQCFIQLSFLGCLAIITCGDSLTDCVWHTFYTPFYYLSNWKFRPTCDSMKEARNQSIIINKQGQYTFNLC